ncbi:MAG: hypothetical protein R3D46_04295 [Defluviimonas denitrificans]
MGEVLGGRRSPQDQSGGMFGGSGSTGGTGGGLGDFLNELGKYAPGGAGSDRDHEPAAAVPVWMT